MENVNKEKKDKVILGVCIRLGKYFKMDPLVFRILFVGLFLFWGLGGVLYLIASFLLPDKKKEDNENNT